MPNAKYFKYDEEYNLVPVYNDDVVEVVRCKDCKYNYLDPNNEKKCFKVDRTPDFFCADGEKTDREKKEIMVKYIKADDVLDGMKKHNFMAKWMTIGDFVDSMPSADVKEVKHGNWSTVCDGFVMADYYVCSLCGHKTFEHYPNFCPHCGANMVEERKEKDE